MKIRIEADLGRVSVRCKLSSNKLICLKIVVVAVTRQPEKLCGLLSHEQITARTTLYTGQSIYLPGQLLYAGIPCPLQASPLGGDEIPFDPVSLELPQGPTTHHETVHFVFSLSRANRQVRELSAPIISVRTRDSLINQICHVPSEMVATVSVLSNDHPSLTGVIVVLASVSSLVVSIPFTTVASG